MALRTASDCVFCKIVAGAIPCFKLYEDEATVAFLDINPVHPGHSLVITRNHAPTLMESDDADLARALPVARRIAQAVASVVAPDGISLVQANGPGAAQSVPHFHIHVLPRRNGDELKVNWDPEPGDMGEIAAMAEKLRAAL
jgi:histidine triad (HIT) family protein